MNTILLGTLGLGRAWAESKMTDTCVVTRKDGTVWDETAGKDVPNIVTVYSGRCGVKPPTNATADDTGDRLTVVNDHVLSIPVTDELLEPDDVVLVTESAADPGLVGVELKVKGPFAGSHTTARRYRCQVVTGRVG